MLVFRRKFIKKYFLALSMLLFRKVRLEPSPFIDNDQDMLLILIKM